MLGLVARLVGWVLDLWESKRSRRIRRDLPVCPECNHRCPYCRRRAVRSAVEVSDPPIID